MCGLTPDDHATIIEVLRTHASCIEHATPPPHEKYGPKYGPMYAEHREEGVRIEEIARRLAEPCPNCGN